MGLRAVFRKGVVLQGGRVACQDLEGMQWALVYVSKNPGWPDWLGRGLGRKRGWELFCKDRARAGFRLKIVTSQLLFSLSTLTFHDPKLLFCLPLEGNKAESGSQLGCV